VAEQEQEQEQGVIVLYRPTFEADQGALMDPDPATATAADTEKEEEQEEPDARRDRLAADDQRLVPVRKNGGAVGVPIIRAAGRAQKNEEGKGGMKRGPGGGVGAR
jgi:hypothetical protein